MSDTCTGCGADLSTDEHFDGCALVTLDPCEDCGSDTVDHYDGCALDGVVMPLLNDRPDDECPDCALTDGAHRVDCTFEPPPVPEEPDTFDDTEGSWIFVPNDGIPSDAEAQGMVAHAVSTRCRWSWRDDHTPGVTQPCCYSILTTISRIPGPAQPDRNWLSHQTHTEASQAVTPPTEGENP